MPSGCQALTRAVVDTAEDWKGRQKVGCGDPPSVARSQKTGGGILGIQTEEESSPEGLLFCAGNEPCAVMKFMEDT